MSGILLCFLQLTFMLTLNCLPVWLFLKCDSCFRTGRVHFTFVSVFCKNFMGYCFIVKVVERNLIISGVCYGIFYWLFPTFLDPRVILLIKTPPTFIISIDIFLWEMSCLTLTHKNQRNGSFGLLSYYFCKN